MTDPARTLQALIEWEEAMKALRIAESFAGLADDVIPVVDAGTLRESLPADGTQHDSASRDQTS
jgi:hypothetical protein